MTLTFLVTSKLVLGSQVELVGDQRSLTSCQFAKHFG